MTNRPDYETRFKSRGIGTRNGQQPISVMLPVEIDEIVRALPNRSAWIREAIIEKLQREQILDAS